MKKVLVRLNIIAIVFSIICISCEEESLKNNDVDILFERIYVNNAWGHQYSHWIIDQDGNVRISSKTDSRYLGPPVGLNMLSEFDSIAYTLEASDVENYSIKATKVDDDNFEVNRNSKADFGSLEYNCYYYDPETENYEKQLLHLESDLLDSINLDKRAVDIVEWLEDVNFMVYSIIVELHIDED